MRALALAAALIAAFALPRATAAQPTVTVRIGSSVAEGYSQGFFAHEAGLFQKAGITAEVQQFAVGNVVATAVANGTIDVGAGSTITIALAAQRGIPFVIIAPAVIQTPESPAGVMCVAKNATIRGPKDLEGKTVAVSSLRQAGDLAVRAWLTRGGADLAKVQIVESSFAQMGAGLERGTFAAANMAEPTLSDALRRNAIRCIGDPYLAIAPTFLIGGWYTTREWAQKNPELARKLAAVFVESARWANTHREDTAAIVSRLTKIDIDTIRNETRPIFGTELSAAQVQPELDASFSFGFLSRRMNAAELLWRP
jgi:NitT/TauT family transport system substrate-binding protein